MLPDKIRLKKYQHQTIENWSNALNIPAAKFVEEAINFYSRYLEGRVTPIPVTTPLSLPDQQQVTVAQLDPDLEDFDGGIEL